VPTQNSIVVRWRGAVDAWQRKVAREKLNNDDVRKRLWAKGHLL